VNAAPKRRVFSPWRGRLGPKWMVFGDQRIAFGNSAGGYGEARLLIGLIRYQSVVLKRGSVTKLTNP
jgi:hypothetical protein